MLDLQEKAMCEYSRVNEDEELAPKQGITKAGGKGKIEKFLR